MSIKKRGSFELAKSLRIFKGKKGTMPRIIGNQALRFFKDTFRKGGFTDNTFSKWTPRFKRLSRTRTSRTVRERANLVKSGKLRRSLQVVTARFGNITLGTRGVNYARRHNEGLTDKKGRTMPKRKFMGNSRKLERDLEKRITKEIDEVFA